MATAEQLLRRTTRLVTRLSGGARLVHPIRRRSVHHYQARRDSWTVVDDFDHDLKFRVDRAGHIGSLIYWCGCHAVSELRCLKRLLRPSMVFADVGANHGEFTLFAAKRLPEGKVLAFEPWKENFRCLQENVALNGFKNVLMFDVGLSDAAHEVVMYTSQEQRPPNGWNEGLPSMFRSELRDGFLGRVRVDVFDEVFEETGLDRLDGMKIDVEGAELFVLRGAIRSLRQYRPFVFMEISASNFEAAGYSTSEVVSLMTSLDYQPFQIKPFGRRRPVSADRLPETCNTVWLPCTSS